MKFQTTHYHLDLLKDTERVSAFFEAINQYSSKTDLAYDLGCGSGLLSYFLSDKFRKIISVEMDSKAYACALKNLEKFNNIKFSDNEHHENETDH